MPKSRIPCGVCGVTGVNLRGTLGPGRCSHCRLRSGPRTCIDCGAVCTGALRCRSCDNASRIIRSPDDHRVLRRQRERDAPGLSRRQREQLLAKWRLSRRICAYCDELATTIDHVVPLVRGGTNYEGNLIPACKSCNSRKTHLTLIEWRTGKRLPPMAKPLPWAHSAPKAIRTIVGQQDAFKTCPECSALHVERGSLCSDECQRAKWRRDSRSRYAPKQKRDTKLVAFLRASGPMSKSAVVAALGTDARTIRRDFTRLVAAGIAQRHELDGRSVWSLIGG